MKLLQVEVDHFKNILKSGPIAIQSDVTCIVGKNESGKTAVLQALHRFNPAQPNVSFNAQRQYPAWLEKQHRKLKDLDKTTPVTARFELDDEECERVTKRLGQGALKSKELKLMRTYGNTFLWEHPQVSESIVISHMLRDVSLQGMAAPTTLDELAKLIDHLGSVTHTDEEKTTSDRELAKALTAARADLLEDKTLENYRAPHTEVLLL